MWKPLLRDRVVEAGFGRWIGGFFLRLLGMGSWRGWELWVVEVVGWWWLWKVWLLSEGVFGDFGGEVGQGRAMLLRWVCVLWLVRWVAVVGVCGQ